MERAGPGGPIISWAEVVNALVSGFNSIIQYSQRLLINFVTPFNQLIAQDSGISSWFTDLLADFLNLFGVDLLYLTPLELMLGSVIPLVIGYTVFRFFVK